MYEFSVKCRQWVNWCPGTAPTSRTEATFCSGCRCRFRNHYSLGLTFQDIKDHMILYTIFSVVYGVKFVIRPAENRRGRDKVRRCSRRCCWCRGRCTHMGAAHKHIAQGFRLSFFLLWSHLKVETWMKRFRSYFWISSLWKPLSPSVRSATVLPFPFCESQNYGCELHFHGLNLRASFAYKDHCLCGNCQHCKLATGPYRSVGLDPFCYSWFCNAWNSVVMRFATFKGHFRNVGSELGGDKDTELPIAQQLERSWRRVEDDGSVSLAENSISSTFRDWCVPVPQIP